MSFIKRGKVKHDPANIRPHLFGHCAPTFGTTKRHCDGCPGEYVASRTTANYTKGTLVKCEHECHGEGREGWPGRFDSLQGLASAPDPDEAETDNPSDEEPESVSESPSAIQVLAERETKRFKYSNGEVARVEEDVIHKGKEKTFVKWVSYDADGERLGDHWTRKDAKEELDA